MERLDQGHLHPKLEVPRLCRTWVSEVGGEHSSKGLFEQRVHSYSEHHVSQRHPELTERN
jgi:hypothetical protein